MRVCERQIRKKGLEEAKRIQVFIVLIKAVNSFMLNKFVPSDQASTGRILTSYIVAEQSAVRPYAAAAAAAVGEFPFALYSVATTVSLHVDGSKNPGPAELLSTKAQTADVALGPCFRPEAIPAHPREGTNAGNLSRSSPVN